MKMQKNLNHSVIDKFRQSGINFKQSKINLEKIESAEKQYIEKLPNNMSMRQGSTNKMENKEKAANKMDYEWRNSLIKYDPAIKETLKANSSSLNIPMEGKKK